MFKYGKANAKLFKQIRMTDPCNSSQWAIEKNYHIIQDKN